MDVLASFSVIRHNIVDRPLTRNGAGYLNRFRDAPFNKVKTLLI